jgi:hypothetical protein
VRGTGKKGYGTFDDAQDVGKRNVFRPQGKLVAAISSRLSMKQLGLTKLAENLLQKPARTVAGSRQFGGGKAFARVLRKVLQRMKGVHAFSV